MTLAIKTENHKKSMDRLPVEILRRICNLLTKSEVIPLCCVSKKFNAAAKLRLYRSILFVDNQDELHLMLWKRHCNEYSVNCTVLSNEIAFDMLLQSLKRINVENQKLIKEFRCVVSFETTTMSVERKIREMLSLPSLSPTLLVIPIFKKHHLAFDGSRLRWLSVGEMINSSYDNDFRPHSTSSSRKLKIEKLQLLHLRSCNENFVTKVLTDIEGLDQVTSLRLTGTSVDDDYQLYPNQLEEMANMFVLSHQIQLLNDGEGFRFDKVKHLTLQKYEFATSAYRKWKAEIGFINFNELQSLALLGCKIGPATDPDLRSAIQNFFLECDFSELEQFVHEHSSVIHPDNLTKMPNLKRFHVSKGSLTFNDVVALLKKLKKLESFSLNDSKLIRDFHRIFNSHRESNVLFSRRFLTEYQFQPTQPIFKYTEDQLIRLLNAYKITTDYILAGDKDDVDPFYDIYFNPDSFINKFLKDTFRPFKEEIDTKILPIAEVIFRSNRNLKYVKVCGMGFKKRNGSCYLDV